jgi:hypothetical protein
LTGYWLLLLSWICTVFVGSQIWPIWRTAVRTGWWLKGGGPHRYFPSKRCTFTIYDRVEKPFLYWVGVISMPIILSVSLSMSLLLTLALWPL